MRAALAGLLALAALTGCGGSDETAVPDDDGSTAPLSTSTGTALSVEDALASEDDGPLSVSGNLLASGGEVRLCSALAESFPPQCGGPSLLVRGLRSADVEGVVTVEGVSWSDRPVVLLGVVRDGTLTVSDNARE